MTDRQSTHGHDCWGWGPKHYECEVRQVEQLAEALREAREYVVSELAAERDVFAGYEHCSNIASIEADLAKIDAAISQPAELDLSGAIRVMDKMANSLAGGGA